MPRPPQQENGKRVAVIGAGPSGLSAAVNSPLLGEVGCFCTFRMRTHHNLVDADVGTRVGCRLWRVASGKDLV